MLALSCVLAAGYVFAPAVPAQSRVPPAVDVKVVTDEADAALAILAKSAGRQAVTEEDWRRLFESEGYVRLKRRETSMRRSFEDADFKTFLLSDTQRARATALAETLARWKDADVTRAARLALAYLPKGAYIRAKIYPVIKPRENSFVFDLDTDPAIFLYLDPGVSREEFENTLAHELHHIGFGTMCPRKGVADENAQLPQNLRTVVRYLGAFGEGFAMLAAAGGPNVHPHAASIAGVRARWDRDVANFNSDLKRVEQFFLDVLAGRLNEAEVGEAAASFYGEQGPWYTVGWKMCVLIEKTYGRRALIEAMCDGRRLLETYNRAAARHNRKSRAPLALWSPSLVAAVTRPAPTR